MTTHIDYLTTLLHHRRELNATKKFNPQFWEPWNHFYRDTEPFGNGSDHVIQTLRQAIDNHDINRYRVILAGIVGCLAVKMNVCNNYPLAAISVHWSSASWGVWMRRPWYFEKGKRWYADDPAVVELYEWIFENIPAHLNPGIHPGGGNSGFRFLCPVLIILETKAEGNFAITVKRLKDNGDYNGLPASGSVDLSSELLKCHPKHIDRELQNEDIIEQVIKLGEQIQRQIKKEEREQLEQKIKRIATDLGTLKAETDVETVKAIEALLRDVLTNTQKDKLSKLGIDIKQRGEELKKSGRQLYAKLKELGDLFNNACSKLSNDRDAIELGQAVLLTAYPIFRAADNFPAIPQRLLIIPISDPLRSAASLGICVVLFDEMPRELNAEDLEPLLSDAKNFGQLLRAIDLEGLAARPEAAAAVAGKVDLGTIVREVANRFKPNPHDETMFPRPCEAYNYALESIMYTMFADFKSAESEEQFTKLSEELDAKEVAELQGEPTTWEPRHWVCWAKRLSDIKEDAKAKDRTSKNAKSTKWQDAPPEWLIKLTGASPAYISFLERIVRDAMAGGDKTTPRIIFMYSEPGCGKEMLAQVLHFARVRHFLWHKRAEELNCLVKENLARDGEFRQEIELRSENDGGPICPKLWWPNEKRVIQLPFLKPRANIMTLPYFILLSYQIVNCGTLPNEPEEFSKELFGSLDNPGPYTKAGVLHGTIFLDEFNTLRDPRVADHLLRVFDPGIVSVRKHGGDGTIDMRLAPLVVVASNYTREELLDTAFNPAVVNRVTQNYYEVPPLRQRKEDILLIIDSLLLKEKQKLRRIDPKALRLLAELPWKDNLRGLQSFVGAVFTRRLIRDIQWPDIEFDEVIEVLADRVLRAEESESHRGRSATKSVAN